MIEAAWADIEPHIVISFSLSKVLAKLQHQAAALGSHTQPQHEEVTNSVAPAVAAAPEEVAAIAPANNSGGILRVVASLFSCFRRPPTSRRRARGGDAGELDAVLMMA